MSSIASNIILRVERVLSEFRRARDMPWAARTLYSLAVELRRFADSLVRLGEEEEAPQETKPRVRRIRLAPVATIPEPLLGRVPARRTRPSEFAAAMEWARTLGRRAEDGLSRIISAAMSLAEHLDRVRSRLLELIGRSGRREVPFHELARDRSEAAGAIVSLLHMELEGEVELQQKILFGEILIRLRRVDQTGVGDRGRALHRRKAALGGGTGQGRGCAP